MVIVSIVVLDLVVRILFIGVAFGIVGGFAVVVSLVITAAIAFLSYNFTSSSS